MPIKPENKARYSPNWSAIRQRILERAHHRCEFCGLPNYSVGRREPNPVWHSGFGSFAEALESAKKLQAATSKRYVVIVLTVAHLDHTPENNSDDNLRALCQQCHLRYDATHHAATARDTRRGKQDQNRGLLSLEGESR